MIDISLPIRLQSPNIQEHWTKRHKRNKKMAQAIGYALNSHPAAQYARKCLWMLYPQDCEDWGPLAPSIEVSLTRFGPKVLDYDNMVYAFKPIRDCVCSWFYPELAAGQADGIEVFKFNYLQEKGKYGIKINIRTNLKGDSCFG